jgi:hypothetical protein
MARSTPTENVPANIGATTEDVPANIASANYGAPADTSNHVEVQGEE